MKKEIIIFYCETTGQGLQHEEIVDYSKGNLERAEQQFRMWSNCYMVKIRTIDEDGFSDEVICKKNIIL